MPGFLCSVSAEYLDLKEVFNKIQATSLSPYCPCNCTIDVLPVITPPRGRLLYLSALERLTIDNYSISPSLGFIHSSSSPTGTGFFLVGRKMVRFDPAKMFEA